MVDQQWNVFAALSERRHHNRDYVQAVVEILPETILGNLFLKISIGRCDDSYVDRNFRGSPHRAHATLLQHT